VGLRERLQLSQSVFARLLPVSVRSLATLESGAAPTEVVARRLIELQRLTNALREVIKKDSLGSWLQTPNDAFKRAENRSKSIDRGETDPHLVDDLLPPFRRAVLDVPNETTVEGPLGFPLTDKQAFNLDVILQEPGNPSTTPPAPPGPAIFAPNFRTPSGNFTSGLTNPLGTSSAATATKCTAACTSIPAACPFRTMATQSSIASFSKQGIQMSVIQLRRRLK